MGARGPKAGPRLSVAPLDAALAACSIDPEFVEGRLGNALRLARSRGYVTLSIADEIACDVLKYHPIVIWGEEYMDIVHPDLGQFDNDIDDDYDETKAVAA